MKFLPLPDRWGLGCRLHPLLFAGVVAGTLVAAGLYVVTSVRAQWAELGWNQPGAGGGLLGAGLGGVVGPATSFDFGRGDCLVPWDEVRAGGPPKDGIPALTHPETITAAEAGLLPGDRVIGVRTGDSARAYPLRLLNWHEIVNDTLGGEPVAVTYCPLCDSALVFHREVGGQVREFGVSGLLFNSNVLMYDRQSKGSEESLWSQMQYRAVCGPAAEAGLVLVPLNAELTTWSRWRERHPDTTVVSFNTGYSRSYDRNPYAAYFEHDRLMFPVSGGERSGDRHPKTRVVLVHLDGGESKAYPLDALRQAGAVDAPVADTFGGRDILLAIVDDPTGSVRITAADGGAEDWGLSFTFWFEFAARRGETPVFGRMKDEGGRMRDEG